MSPKRLVLFDIDGTLLWGGPLWKECFIGALNHYFPQFDFPHVSFGGKTDVQICIEMMGKAGFDEAQVRTSMLLVIDEYVKRATTAVQTRSHEVKILPGVVEILEQLKNNNNVVLGLLTGNVKKGAHVKLSSVQLQDYFDFGVYGDDDYDRYKLPTLAQEKARNELGHSFYGKEIVIIGDTIHDVNCGKSIGVRSIAVGTGRVVDQTELMAQNPDYYFKDLSQTIDVLNAIMEEIK